MQEPRVCAPFGPPCSAYKLADNNANFQRALRQHKATIRIGRQEQLPCQTSSMTGSMVASSGAGSGSASMSRATGGGPLEDAAFPPTGASKLLSPSVPPRAAASAAEAGGCPADRCSDWRPAPWEVDLQPRTGQHRNRQARAWVERMLLEILAELESAVVPVVL
eukprot:CAMPEP_0183416332 /NCGR_PEP_ID=MMETSP0370-20130417/23692_1 /TAXON_ID=268820 /ORGANISM="Peridinium aciculiferum, Strain PAER-2" /LENGTH=163 /DNA_ID=CAMNT_0025599839 /DNA_START=202 /DNA_END=694 /DNA_ORIENTATION=-